MPAAGSRVQVEPSRVRHSSMVYGSPGAGRVIHHPSVALSRMGEPPTPYAMYGCRMPGGAGSVRQVRPPSPLTRTPDPGPGWVLATTRNRLPDSGPERIVEAGPPSSRDQVRPPSRVTNRVAIELLAPAGKTATTPWSASAKKAEPRAGRGGGGVAAAAGARNEGRR